MEKLGNYSGPERRSEQPIDGIPRPVFKGRRIPAEDFKKDEHLFVAKDGSRKRVTAVATHGDGNSRTYFFKGGGEELVEGSEVPIVAESDPKPV